VEEYTEDMRFPRTDLEVRLNIFEIEEHMKEWLRI
jgi:hypothetical protein